MPDYRGKPAVILSVQKQPGADTVALTDQIEAALQVMQKTLPAGISATNVQFRQATFIEASIGGLKQALVEAAIVVALVLLVFLMNVRATLISLTAIPLSFLITLIVFKAFGLTINTMTLGGLAIAIGELVDDAVVDVENILRRLSENSVRPDPRPVLDGHRRGEPGSPLRRALRDDRDRPRLRAAVRDDGPRGPPVYAAGHRLHRLDPRQPPGVDHRDARALLLSVCGPPRRATTTHFSSACSSVPTRRCSAGRSRAAT